MKERWSENKKTIKEEFREIEDSTASEQKQEELRGEMEEISGIEKGVTEKEEQDIPINVNNEKTPKEKREELRKAVELLTKQVEEKREGLLGAENEAVEKEKDYYKQGVFDRVVGKLTGTDETKKYRKESGDKTNAAAAEYEKALEEKLSARLAQKNLNEEKSEKLAARYRRSVISRDVIDRGEKNIASARESVLASKDRSFLEKGLHWFGGRSAALDKKLGKTGGRIARVFLSASVGTAAVVAFGPAGAALAGSIWLSRAARSAIGVFGGAAIGAGAGKVYEKTAGARAANKLAEARLTKAQSAEDIAAKRAAYRSGSAEAIAHNRKRVEMVTALLSGAGLSFAGSGLVGHDMAQAATSTEAQPESVMFPKGVPATAESSFENPMSKVIPHSATTFPFAEPSVGATPGHGYEFMAKRLWGELKLRNLNPKDYAEGSDIRQLLEAKPETIDSVVHKIALDPKHGFFHANGESVVINPDAKMTIDAGGQIRLNDAIQAPEGAPVTPVYHPETPVAATVAPAPIAEQAPPVIEPEPKPIFKPAVNLPGGKVGFIDNGTITHPEAPTNAPEAPAATNVEASPAAPRVEAPAAAAPVENGIFQTHVESNGNKISELSISDKNLENVKFKITTDGPGKGSISHTGTFRGSVDHLLTQKGLGNKVAVIEAREIEADRITLKYLENNNQGNSPEADVLRNHIKHIAEETTKKQGDVFQKIDDINSPAKVPSPKAEAPAAPTAETNPNFKVNANGLSVDMAHAGSYLDNKGNHIIFGGSVEERAQQAAELVSKDHSAVVYFDSTEPRSLRNPFPTHHLSKAYWFEGSGGTIDTANPEASTGIEIRQPRIVNELSDPTLAGKNLPSIDNLKEVYKPINNQK